MTDTSPTLTRKEREFQQRSRDILACAEKLFGSQGYHETTMQMIADAAEFSVGYIYKHFAGKEELYIALVRSHLDQIDRIIDEASAANLPPLDELKRLYDGITSHFDRHRDFMRIYHEEIVTKERELQQCKLEHKQVIARLLRKAAEQGQLRTDDPDLLASMMLGASEKLFHDLAQDNETSFAKVTELLFTLLIDPQRS